MEDNKQELNESLNKIKGMMYYDSKKTAFENEKVIEEQGIMGAPVGSVANDRTSTRTTAAPRRSARQDRRGARRADRADRQADFQTAIGNEPDVVDNSNQNVDGKVYTDFDSVWDYKFEGGMWYTHRKGQDKWISLANYPTAIKKLNAKYFPSANNVTEPKAEPKIEPAVAPTIEPAKIDTTSMSSPGISAPKQDKITGMTNMAQGFVAPEPTISNKDRRRQNRVDRLNKKMGRA